MREPRLGEALVCGVCGIECDIVDEHYLELFHELLDKFGEDKMKSLDGLYSIDNDRFRSYDGCEDETSDFDDAEVIETR